MFDFLNSGLLIVGDTLLFVLVLYLITKAISEIREGNRIEEELKTVLNKREAFYND